jgi:hypothetical protein
VPEATRIESKNVSVDGSTFHSCQPDLGGPFGRVTLDTAAEVTVTHARHDDTVRNGELKLLVDRHVNPDTRLPAKVCVTRDTPGEDERADGAFVSLAARAPDEHAPPRGGEIYDPHSKLSKHAQEWDFLKEHVQKALSGAGLSSNCTDREKVNAFSDYAVKFKAGPLYDSFHPVDVLLHASYCTGAANVVFALCNVVGLPCRSISIANHSMVEVLCDGRWHFVDNHVDGPRFIADHDYVDVTLNVDKMTGFTERQRGYLAPAVCWRRSPWHFSGMLNWHWAWGECKLRGKRTDLTDGYGIGVPCDPQHARALYPERKRYPFPLWNGKPELTLTEKTSWLRLDLRLKPGERLLKQFYVGECRDNPVTAAHVDWWFRGTPGSSDAVLRSGGKVIEHPQVLPGHNGVSMLRFALPLDIFQTPGHHSLVLENRSSQTLRAIGAPTPVTSIPAISTQQQDLVDTASLAFEPIVVEKLAPT